MELLSLRYMERARPKNPLMMRYLPVTILCLFGSLACEKEKTSETKEVYIGFYNKDLIEGGIRTALSDEEKSYGHF